MALGSTFFGATFVRAHGLFLSLRQNMTWESFFITQEETVHIRMKPSLWGSLKSILIIIPREGIWRVEFLSLIKHRQKWKHRTIQKLLRFTQSGRIRTRIQDSCLKTRPDHLELSLFCHCATTDQLPVWEALPLHFAKSRQPALLCPETLTYSSFEWFIGSIILLPRMHLFTWPEYPDRCRNQIIAQ